MTLIEPCSYFVLMESSNGKRRFTPPWRVEEENAETFVVTDANGTKVAWVHHREASSRYYLGALGLSWDEARRIANARSLWRLVCDCSGFRAGRRSNA